METLKEFLATIGLSIFALLIYVVLIAVPTAAACGIIYFITQMIKQIIH